MNQKNLFKEYEEIFSEPDAAAETKEKKTRVFGYSPFAMQDAIGEKNIKKIWIEYEKLRFSGIPAEDLIHKVVGKVRDMLAIALGATKEDLGIKSDYPYGKSKTHLRNWQESELKKLYEKLVAIYHGSRMGEENLELALEKTLLSI